MYKKAMEYKETLKQNLKDPDVQRTFKEGMAKSVGLVGVRRIPRPRVPVPMKPYLDKRKVDATKAADRVKYEMEKNRRARAIAEKAVKGAAAGAVVGAAKPLVKGAAAGAAASFMMNGVKYVLDRGRYKAMGNVGSVSASKGDRGVGRAYRHQGGW